MFINLAMYVDVCYCLGRMCNGMVIPGEIWKRYDGMMLGEFEGYADVMMIPGEFGRGKDVMMIPSESNKGKISR